MYAYFLTGVQEKRVDAMLTTMFARYCKLLQDETGTWLTKSQKAYQLMTETESDQLLCESTYNLESIKLSEVQGGWIKEFHASVQTHCVYPYSN